MNLFLVWVGMIMFFALITFKKNDWLLVLGATTFLSLIAIAGALIVWFVRSLL